MSSTWGSNLKISIFGESHSKAIGIVIDGIPAGTVIDREQLLAFLARRSSRGGKLDTPRIEADQPQLLSGMLPDPQDPNLLVACGTPVCAMIENANTQSRTMTSCVRLHARVTLILPDLCATTAATTSAAADIFPVV